VKMAFNRDPEAAARHASIPLRRVMVLNPNTDPQVTALLRRAARASAPPGCRTFTRSVSSGPTALRDAADLVIAERQVLSLVRAGCAPDGLVIAAFGDPGLEAAQAVAAFPVAGLGASGLAAAAAHGRFAILTLGPGMDAPLRARIARLGLADRLAGLRYLDADIPDVARNPDRFLPAIEAEARHAADAGARALLLGGAPFAGLGQRARAPIPVIDGLKAAIDAVLAR